MARRRQPAGPPAGQLPAALRDHLDPLWRDASAVADLCRTTGVFPADRTHPDLRTAPWWARFDTYRRSWLMANGFEHPQWPGTLDHARARVAGVDMRGTSRYRLRVVGEDD